ncbi:MAG: hypothetical protein GY850_18725, partial [bacterium]|nr:hypothetical protein [bacterium]
SLPSSGTYVLLAEDYESNDTGEYRLFVQRRNNPQIAAPVGFGENLSFTIDTLGEVDTYTFDALEGDVVMVRMTTSSKLDPYFRLYAPDGSLITYKAAYDPGAAEFTSSPLPASGTYVVIAEDYGFNEIGGYNIQLVRIIGTENSLYVTPSQGLNSTGIEGGPFTPASIAYAVKNVGTGPVYWTLTKNTNLLVLSKPGGALAAGETDTVTVSISAEADAFAPEAYFDALIFANTAQSDHVIIRDATLLVKTPEAHLKATPDDPFLSTGPRHGPFTPSSKTYTVENTGDALMEWKVRWNADWLTASPDNGELNSGETANVTVSINDAPNDFAWGVYKDRISFINTTNGYGDTLRDVVLTIEAIPSEISCKLSQSSIVLGEPLEVTGQITPQPNQSGAFVDIALIAPDASEIHRSVVANALGEYGYTVACDDINQAGTWTVHTSWSGDEGLYPATSGDLSLEVIEAESRLTINSTSQALKINVPVDISGKFTPLPDCGGDLTGISIDLNISSPDGVSKKETVITNDRWGHYALQNYTGFDELGDWTVQAVFDGIGNDAYASSESEVLDIKVVESAGYAIVVQGKISSNEGLGSHNKSADFVYHQLIARGLLEEDIMYFNYAGVGQPGVDGIPEKPAIQDAVTQWAKDKLNVLPANLYLVFIDHGFDNVFYIHPDTISAQELKNWLDTMQGGVNTKAATQEKIIILGFCRSGSFIDELSDAHRVIIASAAANESSYKGPLDADGIREGEYFINEYFKSAALGKSVKQSFQEAVALTENFTASDSANSINGPYFDNALQHPLLDDNGDTVGSNDVSDPIGDGLISEDLFIGVNTLTTNDPEDIAITQISGTVFLNENQSTTNLWAQVDNNSRLDTLWIEIKPTGFVPSNQGGSEQIEMDLNKAVFDSYNSTLDRYEWISQDGFSDPGTYQVFYFAKDNISANVSPLRQTTVYKAKFGNLPPNSFSLLLPEDGATDLTSLILDWQDTTDPEGDTFTYTVLLSKGEDTFNNPIRKEGLLYSTTLITPDDGLEDLSTYYWKVHAIDAYGATRESDVRVFHTNNTNPVAGWIHGHVADVATAQPITGAEVIIGGSSLTTSAGGYYLGILAPGTYTAQATASGYNQLIYDQVVVPEGGLTAKDFGLLQLSADSDGDGISNAVENAVSCLDSLDADTDDDGIADGDEDTNQDGSVDPEETDPCDIDSDGDGIQDGTELWVTTPVADPDGTGPLKGTNTNLFQPDLDPSTTTDPLDDDSDNDGLLDGQEDANHNGRVDSGETDPTISDLARLNAMPWIPLLLLDE